MRNDLVIEKMMEIIEKLQGYVGDNDFESFSGNDMLIET